VIDSRLTRLYSWHRVSHHQLRAHPPNASAEPIVELGGEHNGATSGSTDSQRSRGQFMPDEHSSSCQDPLSFRLASEAAETRTYYRNEPQWSACPPLYFTRFDIVSPT